MRLVTSVPVLVAASLGTALLVAAPPAHAQVEPIKNRISVIVDSSGSMLLTPEILTFTETCTGWDPCSFNGNPSAAQETCNSCVVDTINFDGTCAGTWDASCRTDYDNCLAAVTGQAACSPTMTVTEGLATRGDGSLDLPGCDVDGDGIANDSRMYQAKEALAAVVATFGEIEFSLWRYDQVTGGQTCTTNAQCPDTPGGLSILDCENHDNNGATSNVCAFDADRLDAATTAGSEGQCSMFTHTGSPSTFTCGACNFTTSYDRATCSMYDLDQVRIGGTSPLNGSAVSCFPTTNTVHRFMRYHGAVNNAGACDPSGGERLVDFPATGFDDNYTSILSWIDHNQNPFSTTNELRPQGGTPIAASLRDMRASILASATADPNTPCRKYQVIFLTDGAESCEAVANAVTAAANLQNLSFVNSAGVPVSNFDVDVYVIGFAICPPGNPNCQTAQDLNAIAAAGGTSSAFFASNQLELQAALAQIVADSIVSERCNDLDDDCDGEIDEDFAGLGEACSEGVGQCLDDGQIVCTADELGVECTAVAGNPGSEVCNGLDDNCNGLIDDGISCTGCVAQCTDAEDCDTCNGIDEDCDLIFDESFVPQPCGVATGACDPGTTICSGGVVTCDGAIGPQPEICDGLDNDCDNIVDGMTEICYPPATAGCDLGSGLCEGVCNFGLATCDAFPTPPACVGAVTPGAPIACNGLDDDCDGIVEEGLGAEQCNGLDDDCDTLIDEGVSLTDPDIGDACGTPPFIGECSPGVIVCSGGAQVCQGELNPTPELCNTEDDDCDGAFDEDVPGFGGSCGTDTGLCESGTLECVAGAPDCVGDVGPQPELCDGDDNNCNGSTDEADPDLGMVCNELPGGGTVDTEDGECRYGVLVCQAGDLACVGAVGPEVEACNLLDDDCDIDIDEDFPELGELCDNGMAGVCHIDGNWVCAPGGGVVCTAPPGVPGTESCNGLDDDCDIAIDEDPLPLVGEECSPAIGLCEPGLWECNNGDLECGASTSGTGEVCNNADDDCDGFIDEGTLAGEGEDCVPPGSEQYGDIGACDWGQTACVNGEIVCEDYQGPTPEICNGIDDDCDGNGDDFAECPGEEDLCVMGECVLPCGEGEFPCGAGMICVDLPEGDFCVDNPCFGQTCDPGFSCDPADGVCHDLCEDVECRTGEECRNGFCLDCFDLPTLCLEGELCVADEDDVGQCVDNACDPNPCDEGEACIDGACLGDCGAGCPAGEICVSGECELDRCDGVECNGDQVCNPENGECTGSNCEGVQCESGEICVPISGECIGDPCIGAVCPDGTVCLIDASGRPNCEVPPPPDVDRVTAAGGGCAAGGGRGGDAGWLLLLGLAALPLARRRRRERPSTDAGATAGGAR